jgi:hypothetical protein
MPNPSDTTTLADIKKRAHNKLSAAIRKGTLPKAKTLVCRECDSQALHWHHHNGYGDALDVIPLCANCHAKKHGRNRDLRNDRIRELRRNGLSFGQIRWQLIEDGWEPLTAEAVRKIVIRQQRSLERLQDLNKEAGR